MLTASQDAQEYRKKFHSYYYGKIADDLARFETERGSALFWYTLWLSMVAVCVFGAWWAYDYYSKVLPYDIFYGSGHGRDHGVSQLIVMAGGALVGLCIYFASRVQKRFENRVKEEIIHSFLSFFGDFTWSCKESISAEEIRTSGLVGGFNWVVSDDYFKGTHKGLNVIISENRLVQKSGKNSNKIFEGLFIKVDVKKPFNTHTVIREDTKLGAFVKPDIRMQEIELEDVEFNKMFNVYAYDQTEARFLLTTAFMERFKKLRDVYKAKDIRASFRDNSLIIAIPCKKDMFQLGNVRKPVTDTGQMQELFEEFITVLSLIELLNLDSKTGL